MEDLPSDNHEVSNALKGIVKMNESLNAQSYLIHLISSLSFFSLFLSVVAQEINMMFHGSAKSIVLILRFAVRFPPIGLKWQI